MQFFLSFLCYQFADYSIKTTNDDGEEIAINDVVAIERKLGISELVSCFTTERKRFEREYERAKAKGAKIYTLVEGASFEAMYAHRYTSKMLPQSLLASVYSWQARYNTAFVFCKAETSGKVIKDILRYELREYLKKVGEENG